MINSLELGAEKANATSSGVDKFYYHTNISLEEEVLRELVYAGFTPVHEDLEYPIEFEIESGSPLIIKLQSCLIEVESIDHLKNLVHFNRALQRLYKLNESMHLTNLDELGEGGVILEKVYQESDSNFIGTIFKLNDVKNEFAITKIKKNTSQNYLVVEDYCFEDEENYYLLKDKGENTQEFAIGIANAITLISANDKDLANEAIGISELINQLSFPVVILNDDIVNFHNDHFSKLGITPGQLLKSVDSGWIDIDENKYKILSSTSNHLQIICLVRQEFNYSKSHSELGIITSSIAHELNNPLAGILAAINMLELEDWAEEDAATLEEMKASAKRCQNLVSTFLGFSRLKEKQGFDQSFGTILEQATTLLSNRKIESGISIETNVSAQLENAKICGASLPIILYLILSEMMTLKNHELLIEKGDSTIKCSFTLNGSDIKLNVKNLNLEGQKSKILGRLIGHLLGLENSRVDIIGQDIIIYNLL